MQDIALSPNGSLAVTAGDDRIAKVWSLHTFSGGMQFSEHGAPVSQASFSPEEGVELEMIFERPTGPI